MRLLLAILLLVLAFGLQFFFASAGLFINFTLATLLSFVFFFDLWELVVFILLAIFVVNWQPAISFEIILFAALPLIAYALRGILNWEPWIANMINLIAALFILYISVAPTFFLSNLRTFFLDLFGSIVFGSFVFSSMGKMEQR